MPPRQKIALLRALTLATLFSMSLASVAAAAEPPLVGREATIESRDGVNIRAQPRAGAAVVTIAGGGDFVNVLAGPEKDGDQSWYRVEYDGMSGWALGSLLGPARARASVSSRGGLRANAQASAIWLPVPYRSQFDGNAYQSGNCGPTTLSMTLAAFGKNVSINEIRRAANRMQGTTGWYDSGVGIDVLADLASRYGLVVRGLRRGGGFDRWSFDEVRAALRAGHLVVPQVHLATMPGQERSNRSVDHFVVLTGFDGKVFRYNDPAFGGYAGQGLSISEDLLALAWKRSDYPFAAFSVAPGDGMIALVEPEAAPAPEVVEASAAVSEPASQYPLAATPPAARQTEAGVDPGPGSLSPSPLEHMVGSSSGPGAFELPLPPERHDLLDPTPSPVAEAPSEINAATLPTNVTMPRSPRPLSTGLALLAAFALAALAARRYPRAAETTSAL